MIWDWSSREFLIEERIGLSVINPSAVVAGRLTHEEMVRRLRLIRSEPGLIRLKPYIPRCLQCASKIKPWQDYTIYDPTLRRASRPYCGRCYRQVHIIERSVQP